MGDVGKFFRPVEPRPGEAGDTLLADGNHQAVAVELGFVQPVVTGRCLGGESCELRLDEGGRLARPFPLTLWLGMFLGNGARLDVGGSTFRRFPHMGFLFTLTGRDLLHRSAGFHTGQVARQKAFAVLARFVVMLLDQQPVLALFPSRGFIRTSVQPPCMR
jgi:hypothetical protein